MPLPAPKENEKKDEWMKRCVGMMAKKFKDPSQSAAICHRIWKTEGPGKDDPDEEKDEKAREETSMSQLPIVLDEHDSIKPTKCDIGITGGTVNPNK